MSPAGIAISGAEISDDFVGRKVGAEVIDILIIDLDAITGKSFEIFFSRRKKRLSTCLSKGLSRLELLCVGHKQNGVCIPHVLTQTAAHP